MTSFDTRITFLGTFRKTRKEWKGREDAKTRINAAAKIPTSWIQLVLIVVVISIFQIGLVVVVVTCFRGVQV